MVERAIERGEAPAGALHGEFIRTLVAPLYLRLLVTGESLDEAAADRAASVAAQAAAAGAHRP